MIRDAIPIGRFRNMTAIASPAEWVLGAILLLSALGILLLEKPVHASLSFLVTLLALSALYLQLNAQFIAAMQILVYAGAILVIFMFVIILFQDAHKQITRFEPLRALWVPFGAATLFAIGALFLGQYFVLHETTNQPLPPDYGTVQSLGKTLYIDFFFPFEAVILLFLIAIVGSLYIAKRIE